MMPDVSQIAQRRDLLSTQLRPTKSKIKERATR